jgi:hypothetical protein
MTSATEFKGTKTRCWNGCDEDAASVYAIVTGDFGEENAIEICSTLREDGDFDVEAADAEFIADAFNVRLETGLTPRELADKVQQLSSENETLRIHQGASLAAMEMSDRVKLLEGERAEVVRFAKMVAESCQCECAVTPHDQHQDGCMHWLQARTNALIAKLEGTQGK